MLAVIDPLRVELTYTDGDDSFRYSGVIYSSEFDLVSKRSRK